MIYEICLWNGRLKKEVKIQIKNCWVQPIGLMNTWVEMIMSEMKNENIDVVRLVFFIQMFDCNHNNGLGHRDKGFRPLFSPMPSLVQYIFRVPLRTVSRLFLVGLNLGRQNEGAVGGRGRPGTKWYGIQKFSLQISVKAGFCCQHSNYPILMTIWG